MDNFGLVMSAIVIGGILLDLVLRSLWIRQYLVFGISVHRATKSVPHHFEVASWKIFSTDEGRYFHNMEYRDYGGLIIIREELTFMFRYGFGKLYYTPVVHAVLRHDPASGTLSLRLVTDPMPTLVGIASFLFPVAVGLYFIANIQKKRYLQIFESL